MTILLDGRAVAGEIRAALAEPIAELEKAGIAPALSIVLATADEGAWWYARAIVKAAQRAGIGTQVVDLGQDASETLIADSLASLAADPAVHGIIVQTPLPVQVDRDRLVSLLPLPKDIDGASPLSAGRLMSGLTAFAPCTAAATMELLTAYDVRLSGARAVVVGRSMVVGKPVAQLLLAQDATVTTCHSRTVDLPAVTREADVLIAAVGRPGLIGADYVKPGAVVVDVGTTPDADGNLTGDVDAASVAPVAGALSPVPGGVGPVTTAVLLRNTVLAARQQQARSLVT